MPKLIFRGTYIRFVDMRYDVKSKTVYHKINFTASFSKPVREAMEWGEPPAGFAGSHLDGQLFASNLILTPNGELQKHEIQLSAKEIGSFHLARVADEDNESKKWELRFQLVTDDSKAAGELRKYLSVIGKGEAQLRVNYEAQSELEMEAAADTSEAADEPT